MPAHVTKPKERKWLFLVQLPEKGKTGVVSSFTCCLTLVCFLISQYPFVPPHITRPKEHKSLCLVQLPAQGMYHRFYTLLRRNNSHSTHPFLLLVSCLNLRMSFLALYHGYGQDRRQLHRDMTTFDSIGKMIENAACHFWQLPYHGYSDIADNHTETRHCFLYWPVD